MNTKTYTAIVVTTEFRLKYIPYAEEVEYVVVGDARKPNEETIRIVVKEEHEEALSWLLFGHNSVIAFGEGEPEDN